VIEKVKELDEFMRTTENGKIVFYGGSGLFVTREEVWKEVEIE